MGTFFLNDKQAKAVKHKQGPLLIIAGAGTGKTTVICERVKHLIEKKWAKPSEILALTFTEKASREMQTRVDEALPYGYTQMWISTFHSFCDRILREKVLHIGFNPRFKLLTEAESVQLIRKHLFEFDLDYFRPLGNPNKFIEGLLNHFSRLCDEDITPNQYIDWVNAKCQMSDGKRSEEKRQEIKKWKELAGAFKKYDEIKIRDGYFDYGDLITKTLLLFRKRKNILNEYKKQFKYLLVDEYQDTNFAQNELVKLLAGRQGNVTVVADDDQAIYRWRGAATSNVIQFRKNFPKTKIITLTQNYRSTQEILDRAYDLIQYNNPNRLEVIEKINKKLISNKKKQKGEKIRFIHTDRAENEADGVAKEVIKLLQDKDSKYHCKDIAILIRANNHHEPFARALLRHGISYQFLGPGRLFRQPEIIDLLAYLKVIYNFEDSVAFFRLLSIDYFDIPARDLAALGNIARKKNTSLFEVCEEAVGYKTNPAQTTIPLNTSTVKKISKLVGIIHKHLSLARRETAGQILYYFLEETGYLNKIVSPESPDAQKKAANISKFFDRLKSYEIDHEDATVAAVVDWINLAMELGESPAATDSDWTEVDAVNILTAHSAKGLEFPVVFLVNLVGARFPTGEKRETIPIPQELIKEVLPQGDYHLQEERRLFYVAMTRAKERLYFTAADYYGEGKREKNISPFVYEALGKQIAESELTFANTPNNRQLSFLAYEPQTLVSTLGDGLSSAIHIDYLSYSQIETFKTCPLHYKLKFIYSLPTPPSPSQNFGISLHQTLRDFYRLDKKRTLAELLRLLNLNWIKEGYLSKKHEQKFREKGKKFLTEYFKHEYNPGTKTILTEEPFTLNLKQPSVKVRPLKIGGRIDRVDRLPDGTLEIIDYKTGANVPTQREIDRNLQMTFYALAATHIKQEPFGESPDKVRMTFYYFDNQKKISTIRTKEQLQAGVEEIFRIRREIENSDFACSKGYICNNCEYRLLCNSGE